jgi:LPS export ABC transporter protein LptC
MYKKICLIIICLSLFSCQSPPISQEQSLETETEAQSRLDTQLTLTNATLEQSDTQGKTLWKIKAEKVVYSENNEQANLTNLTGNIFRGDELILKIKADKGLIENDGEIIFLDDNIVATDQRNESVIKADKAQWNPKEDILILRENIKGIYPNWDLKAKSARYLVEEERLELIGDIVAITEKPFFQIKTNHLWWEIKQKKMVGDQPLEITEYENKKPKSLIVANKGEFYLEKEIIVLENNIQYKSNEPPLQISTNSAIWNFKNQTIESAKPIKIIHTPSQLNMTGNKGQLNLKTNVAKLWGGVQGKSEKNQSQLSSSELTWNLTTQMMEALGEVVYQQNNPKFSLSGIKAVGKLQDNTLVITGAQNKQVSTEIYPN